MKPPQEALRLYVVWHPQFSSGISFARAIHRHFDSLGMVRDGVRLSVPVRMRSEPASGKSGEAPRPIDLELAENTAIIVLVDTTVARASRKAWKVWFDDLETATKRTTGARVIKVLVGNAKGFAHFAGENYEAYSRYGSSDGSVPAHLDRLLIRIGHDIAKDLWKRWNPQRGEPLDRLTVFLSHARGDEDVGGGALIAQEIDSFLSSREYGLQGFLDVRDTQNGVHYETLFEDRIRNGVVLAIYSPRYGTRPFCRKELLWAKRYRCPLLIALRMDSGEERTFPYKGNAPLRVIRKSTPKRPIFAFRRTSLDGPGVRIEQDTIRSLIKDLVSEVLRCLVWRRTAERACEQLGIGDPVLLPRPVELVDIAYMMIDTPQRTSGIVVYPDPPLDDAEMRLITAVARGFSIKTLTQLEAGT